jgi:phage terminase small subunit
LFVAEYARDMDALRAVKEAGYQGSAITLSATATKLKNNPQIQAALAEIGTKLDKSMLSVDHILAQLARVLYADIVQYIDAEGNLTVAPKDLPYDMRQAIESIEIDKETEHRGGDEDPHEVTKYKTKIKLVSKAKAIELAMRYQKLLQPNATVNINAGTVNFNWDKFYTEVPDNVGERLKLALGDGEITDVEQPNNA